MKRWLPFLIINILISALTTLLVLTLWNRISADKSLSFIPPEATHQTSVVVSPPVELPPLDQEVIKISNVFAPGDLQNELLIIERIGEGDLNLGGWKIIDEQDNTYEFPSIDLVKGQISLYSRSGMNTANALFWGSEKAIWTVGETIRILDSAGQERTEFVVQ